MKIRITMKNADAVHDAVKDAVKESVMGMEDLSKREKESIIEVRQEEVWDKVSQWFECGEYLTVEVDTEANTCIVIK